MSDSCYTIVMKAINAWLDEIKKMHNEGDCADFCIV